jgi:hypothetical protein
MVHPHRRPRGLDGVRAFENNRCLANLRIPDKNHLDLILDSCINVGHSWNTRDKLLKSAGSIDLPQSLELFKWNYAFSLSISRSQKAEPAIDFLSNAIPSPMDFSRAFLLFQRFRLSVREDIYRLFRIG